MIPGTGDGIEIVRALGLAYSTRHPECRVLVPPGIGSNGAIAAVGSDGAAIGRISRDLSDSEKAWGLVRVPIFELPIVFAVNAEAGISKLSAAQIARLFEGYYASWRELGGNDVPIRLIRRDESDASLGVLRARLAGWRALRLAEKSSHAATPQEVLDMVRRVPGAIGFGAYSALPDARITLVELEGKAPLAADYPLRLTLALVLRPHQAEPAVRGFVQFATSGEAEAIGMGFHARRPGA